MWPQGVYHRARSIQIETLYLAWPPRVRRALFSARCGCELAFFYDLLEPTTLGNPIIFRWACDNEKDATSTHESGPFLHFRVMNATSFDKP